MKLPAHLYLDGLGIAYRALTFPPETPKGAASVADALGFRPGQMVKTLLFETGEGERVLVMVAADRSAASSHLKKVLASRDVHLASPEAVKATTGYEIGSVPPFHWQTADFRSFVDEALTREPLLGVGAGVWGNEILITPRSLVRAARAIVVNLTERDRPVVPEAALE
jgi:Cys-tRNA(Pro)/Cys-tRNA(Cys) deacylase